jgi:hypothetical protein
VSEQWTGLRRGKLWWKARTGGAPLTVAPQRVQEPPAEALGKEAIRCWVFSCGSCTLEGALRGCQHEGVGRAPVMLQETQAVQVTKPKLSQLSDAPDFHDPWVTRLRCGPIRVSKLVGRDFQELGDLGMLSAPCPLEPPPCGGKWVELWQDAVVHASTWSQAVHTRMYFCKCPRKHTIHYDGEHLGLYVWSRQTILVQESLQLLLKQMQRGQSGFGALLEGQQEAFRRAPECAVLSEETWRKASLDYFRLVGRQILECCSVCGPHPEVSILIGEELKLRPLERV